MAKRIPDTNEYLPGVIYQLQVCVDGNWEPFYVGETTNPGRRLREHQLSAQSATEHSTFVYRSIAVFETEKLEWRMMTVHEYGTEGPEAAEDEHIMMLLRQGVTLTNEKKGNANWMTERVAQAADMVRRKINNYQEYKKVITAEQLRERQLDWLAEDATEHRALPDKFYREVEERAERLALEEQAKKQRAVRREESVRAARAVQIAEWEARNGQ
jgi:predicted GIY-YIG superfamily endonuclease